LTYRPRLDTFDAALNTWLTAHDLCLADLQSRHEQHKADLKASGDRVAAFLEEHS